MGETAPEQAEESGRDAEQTGRNEILKNQLTARSLQQTSPRCYREATPGAAPLPGGSRGTPPPPQPVPAARSRIAMAAAAAAGRRAGAGAGGERGAQGQRRPGAVARRGGEGRGGIPRLPRPPVRGTCRRLRSCPPGRVCAAPPAPRWLPPGPQRGHLLEGASPPFGVRDGGARAAGTRPREDDRV